MSKETLKELEEALQSAKDDNAALIEAGASTRKLNASSDKVVELEELVAKTRGELENQPSNVAEGAVVGQQMTVMQCIQLSRKQARQAKEAAAKK